MRALLALAALALIGSAPPPKLPKIQAQDVTFKLICFGPDGGVTGTGFYYRPHMLITAAHVAAGRLCFVNGQPAETVYADGLDDIAVVQTVAMGPGSLPISCEKPKKGRVVYVFGHPNGGRLEKRVFVALDTVVTDGEVEWLGLSMFDGAGTAGQSGSAIVDHGKVIGILKGTNQIVMLGRLLKDTFLCQR